MRYLVTGASGFIGAHLTSQLISEGHEVLGIDNFNSYYSPELKFLRKDDLKNRYCVDLKDIDICDKKRITEEISEFQPDSIVHLAAQPGIRLPLNKSDEYIRNNILGFTNVIEGAIALEIPNFLYASSSSVYGNSTKIPFLEKEEGLKPISLYGATKLCNEFLASSYTLNSNTRSRGMRFFTVYGPSGRPDMAYFRLIASALTGSNFRLFGEGNAKRDFTYVGDIVRMIVALDKELMTRPKEYVDVVNIGGGDPHSMLELIATIEDKTGLKIAIQQEERNRVDTKFTCASTDLIQDLTGVVPSTKLGEGLDHVLAWAMLPKISQNLIKWSESTY